MTKRFITNGFISFFSAILCFVAGEIIIRVLEPPKSTFEYIVFREDTKRFYELRPNSRGTLLGKEIKVSSLGIRDYEYKREKDKGTFRIIGLGDSITMGAGVNIEDTYLKKLETYLNDQTKKMRYEILNFGIWGYNTVQEVDFFEAKGLLLSPDLVILGFFPNDASKTTTLGKEYRPYLTKVLNCSHLIRYLKPRLASLGRRLKIPIKTYVSGLIDDFSDHSVNWEKCKNALRRLKVLSDKYDFKVIVVMIPIAVELSANYPLRNINAKLSEFCGNEGIVFWDALNVFEAMSPRSLLVSITDAHFNESAHALLAGFIFENLNEFNFLIPK